MGSQVRRRVEGALGPLTSMRSQEPAAPLLAVLEVLPWCARVRGGGQRANDGLGRAGPRSPSRDWAAFCWTGSLEGPGRSRRGPVGRPRLEGSFATFACMSAGVPQGGTCPMDGARLGHHGMSRARRDAHSHHAYTPPRAGASTVWRRGPCRARVGVGCVGGLDVDTCTRALASASAGRSRARGGAAAGPSATAGGQPGADAGRIRDALGRLRFCGTVG